MNQTLPQLVDTRKLTETWVALSMARNIAIHYLNDLPEKPGLEPLLKVLNVSRDLIDEMLREAFPQTDETSVEELVM